MKRNPKNNFYNYIFKIPIFGTIIATIFYIYKLIRLNADLNNIYKEEKFLNKLSMVLNIKLKKDWVGRLYGIINPATQLTEEESSLLIFEMKDNGRWSIDSFIEKWVYKKLNILNTLLVETEMLDLLYIKVNHVGPEDQMNYLVTLTPFQFTNLEYYLNKLKKQFKFIFILGIIGLMGFLTWKYIF